jgi:hypothetical protein
MSSASLSFTFFAFKAVSISLLDVINSFGDTICDTFPWWPLLAVDLSRDLLCAIDHLINW